MTFLNNSYREIITKAVCASGEKLTKVRQGITPPEEITSILGCWVINHTYEANKKCENKVEIHGSYDINVWCAFAENKQTSVVLEQINYCIEVELSNIDDASIQADEVIVKVTHQPNCLQCKLVSCDEIEVEIEKGFTVSVIGETRLSVKTEPPVVTQAVKPLGKRLKVVPKVSGK